MEDSIKEYGMEIKDGILILSVIGEIEGHDNAGKEGKTTKYEHMLPILAKAEKNSEVKGILFLVNTVGGDVSAGLALAEMISRVCARECECPCECVCARDVSARVSVCP